MSPQAYTAPLTLPGRLVIATRSWREGLRTRRGQYDRFADQTLCPVPTAMPTFSPIVPIAKSGGGATFSCAGYGTCVLHLTGHWRGLVSFTTSDDRVIWQPISLIGFTTGTAITETTEPGIWRTPAGFTGRYLRVQAHALVAGTITGAFGAAPLPEALDIPLSCAA